MRACCGNNADTSTIPTIGFAAGCSNPTASSAGDNFRICYLADEGDVADSVASLALAIVLATSSPFATTAFYYDSVPTTADNSYRTCHMQFIDPESFSAGDFLDDDGQFPKVTCILSSHANGIHERVRNSATEMA